MRTTLTLDEDVAKALRREMRRTGTLSLKEAVNHLLRLGLVATESRAKPFQVRPRPLGLPAGLSYDNVEELLETLEGASHK